ncbi:HAD-IA family hydrolase [Sphingobium sp. H33]|uniref:HAD-IA family hydrolase n=2 Tax=Sphingobium nicotianae TaxID=2782607 RepID=A0A9X1DGD4_9SPHN|nr:HAD-IA family hydrolase [Sphingobium nicotianae]
MLDVDGVLIIHPAIRGWAVNLERDLGLSVSRLQEAFFTPHWDDIIHGRARLRDRLAPVLAEIAPALRCDDFIDYWFANDAHLNQPLLEEVAQVRAQGVPVHLATVQEHERARYLWEMLDLRARFDGLHYAADLGATKPHPDFYARIEARTGFAPSEIFFADDKQVNIDAARARGWHAAHWAGHGTLAGLLAAAGGEGNQVGACP